MECRNDLLFPNIDATSRFNALYFASFFILTNFILGACLCRYRHQPRRPYPTCSDPNLRR
jgi:hypothetical protein